MGDKWILCFEDTCNLPSVSNIKLRWKTFEGTVATSACSVSFGEAKMVVHNGTIGSEWGNLRVWLIVMVSVHLLLDLDAAKPRQIVQVSATQLCLQQLFSRHWRLKGTAGLTNPKPSKPKKMLKRRKWQSKCRDMQINCTCLFWNQILFRSPKLHCQVLRVILRVPL